LEKNGRTLQVPFVTMTFFKNKVVLNVEEGLEVGEDLLANFLIDFEN
jgi:hypothetical protein